MKRNIKVERLNQKPIEQQEIELVERKGIGHPDSVADGLAERPRCVDGAEREASRIGDEQRAVALGQVMDATNADIPPQLGDRGEHLDEMGVAAPLVDRVGPEPGAWEPDDGAHAQAT